jgi:acetyl esterase/lipase
MKKGTSISALIPEGEYERVEATRRFNKNFPPTFFVHGNADIFADWKLTLTAHEQLKALGVETEFLVGEGLPHVFDFTIKYTDPLFAKYVVPALDFLKTHV